MVESRYSASKHCDRTCDIDADFLIPRYDAYTTFHTPDH
jgi:hypothetical protein